MADEEGTTDKAKREDRGSISYRTVCRHIMASNPGYNEEDALAEIKDAVFNLDLIPTAIPNSVMNGLSKYSTPDGGVIVKADTEKIGNQFITESFYRRGEVLRIWPPHAISDQKVNNRKSAGGRPQVYHWDELAVCFGAMLQDERELGSPEDIIRCIQKK